MHFTDTRLEVKTRRLRFGALANSRIHVIRRTILTIRPTRTLIALTKQLHCKRIKIGLKFLFLPCSWWCILHRPPVPTVGIFDYECHERNMKCHCTSYAWPAREAPPPSFTNWFCKTIPYIRSFCKTTP